jgi:uncharacterized protein (DUF2236 family)
MTARPDGIQAGPHTTDDGLYGPDSVTWRVFANPSVGIAATAAAMVQMLLPPVMYVVDQASSVRLKPELRAKMTGDYTVTITYGDVASAERAGEQLRRLHSTRKAVDPITGAPYQADDPDSLVWVHQALTWVLLRGARSYGPSLTPAEEDTFVAEQRAVAARLVGCNLDNVSETVADLDVYMDSMLPKLAMTTPALWFKDMMVPPNWAKTPEGAVKSLIANASAMLMGDEHQKLYGFHFNRFQRLTTVNGTKLLINAAMKNSTVDSVLPGIREYVDTHAFGARRTRVVDPETVTPAS